MTDWTPEQIAKWHEDTFPNATMESQLLKLEEEIGEYFSSEDDMEEYADVYIVVKVLQLRYKSLIGDIMSELLLNDDDVIRCINNKMDINTQRKWEFVDGVYRHVE